MVRIEAEEIISRYETSKSGKQHLLVSATMDWNLPGT